MSTPRPRSPRPPRSPRRSQGSLTPFTDSRDSCDPRAVAEAAQALLDKLHDGLRDLPYMPAGMRRCGTMRAVKSGPRPAGAPVQRADSVRVFVSEGRGGKRAEIVGVTRCKDPWSCPNCHVWLRRDFAREVAKCAAWWRSEGGVVRALTLTIRHNASDTLARTRKGIVKAWRRMTQGAPWKRIVSELGIHHHVRAIQVTYNDGWHPHIHALFLIAAIDPALEAAAVEKLLRRWCRCVEEVLGRRHRPSMAHQRWGESTVDDYLAKADVPVDGDTPGAAAEGRRPGRSTWTIAAGALRGDEADVRLWQEFVRAMKGTRLCTWSRGLREAAKDFTPTRDGAEVASPTAARVDRCPRKRTLVAVIPSRMWDAAARRAGFRNALRRTAARDGLSGIATLLANELWRISTGQALPPSSDIIRFVAESIAPHS